MSLLWLFIGIGGFIGGYLPALFGQDSFSVWSIITGTIGSLVGLWLYRRMDLGD